MIGDWLMIGDASFMIGDWWWLVVGDWWWLVIGDDWWLVMIDDWWWLMIGDDWWWLVLIDDWWWRWWWWWYSDTPEYHDTLDTRYAGVSPIRDTPSIRDTPIRDTDKPIRPAFEPLKGPFALWGPWPYLLRRDPNRFPICHFNVPNRAAFQGPTFH